MPENIQRWRCDCAYDGTEFAGWQKQPSKLAVQDYIDQALEAIKELGPKGQTLRDFVEYVSERDK